MANSKSYLYKVYDRSLNFVGTWPDVTSKFQLSEAINNAGGQVAVTLARPADNFNEGVDIDFGYQVQIYCVDGDAPNGTLVFTGFISNYTPAYGQSEGINVTLLGYGSELEKIILRSALATDQSQATGSTDQVFTDTGKVAQSFVPAVSGLDAVEVKLRTAATQNVTLAIHEDVGGAPGPTALSGSTVTQEVSGSTFAAYVFTFAAQLALVTGRTYWIVLSGPTGSATSVDFNTESSNATVHSYDSSYANTRAGANLSTASGSFMQVGQNNFALYSADEVFCKFDTSSIPDSAVITAVTLKIARAMAGDTGYNIEAWLKDWVAPLSVSDWVAGASISALTRLATLAAASLTPDNTLVAMTLDGSNLLNNINKAGYTNIMFAIDNFKNGSAPGASSSQNSYISSSSGAAAAIPKLSVTYSASPVYAAYATGNPYASGGMYTLSGSVWSAVSNADIYFKTYNSDNATTVAYSSQDPGAIMRDIMDKYIAQGGTLSYDATTIELTGTSATYTFNTNTTLEGIKKCLELAPAGWYFYINQATNMVHFHQKSTSVERTFVLTGDIKSVSPKKTIENMVNTIYFTGGGSPVLFKVYKDTTSIGLYGIKTMRYVDQRVTLAATALLIATALLEQHKAPEMQLDFEVIDNNVASPGGYDIESIVLGEVTGLRSFGGSGSSLWDVAKWDIDYWDYNIRDIGTAQLQIVRLERNEDSIKIFCSTVPPDVNKRIEDINRNLEATQTVNNPSSPS